MTREEKIELLNKLLEIEEKNDIGNLTRAERREFQQWVEALEQEPQTFKWCETCKEYDQEKHCCHRWSKVIRDTVEEMKQEQEPMVEIDLYSVIKQKYIEREVLDKIRAEIIELRSKQNVGVLECLDVIDKYKAESEG